VKWWRAGVVALAAIAAAAPAPSGPVERWYSTWLFPMLQPLVTSAANEVPLALFDVLLLVAVGIALAIVGRVVVTWPRGRMRAVGNGLGSLAVLAASLFLWFWAAWGLNYRRPPLEDRLARAVVASPDDAVLKLAQRAANELNRLHQPAHTAGFSAAPERDPDARAAFDATLRALGLAARVEPGRLKPSVLGPFFRWAGVDGMISPFTLEVLGNPDLLPFERPFAVRDRARMGTPGRLRRRGRGQLHRVGDLHAR
jgi:hypothetical protein